MIKSKQAIDDGILIEVQGDIDFSTSPALRAELMSVLQSAPARLIVDLSDVAYMDSSGVATLVEAMQVQHQKNNKIVLCALQPRVSGIFRISRLDTIFTIVESREAAVNA